MSRTTALGSLMIWYLHPELLLCDWTNFPVSSKNLFVDFKLWFHSVWCAESSRLLWWCCFSVLWKCNSVKCRFMKVPCVRGLWMNTERHGSLGPGAAPLTKPGHADMSTSTNLCQSFIIIYSLLLLWFLLVTDYTQGTFYNLSKTGFLAKMNNFLHRFQNNLTVMLELLYVFIVSVSWSEKFPL